MKPREVWMAAMAVRNSRSCIWASFSPKARENQFFPGGRVSALPIQTSSWTAPIVSSPKRWSAAHTSRQFAAGRPSASTTTTTTSSRLASGPIQSLSAWYAALSASPLPVLASGRRRGTRCRYGS